MATKPAAHGNVEARTQELGRQLYERVQRFRSSGLERLQDRAMLLMMQDPALRGRLLRFVDVQAALRRDPWGRRTASLFREYFSGDFAALPAPLRAALALARAPFVPDPLLAWFARVGTTLTASRFVVPDEPRALDDAIRRLQERGSFSSFDLLGEAVVSDQEARGYQDAYLKLIARLKAHPQARQRTIGGAPCLEVSLKLSSLTPHFNEADPLGTLRRVRPALEDICQEARAAGIGVTVDAEQYRYRDLVWYVFRSVIAPREALGTWPDIGFAIQTYLADADDHAAVVRGYARSRGTPFRVRLVKGAYWDYEAIAAGQYGWRVPVYRDKAETDLAFERITAFFLEDAASIRLAVGSHNIRSHAHAEAVREHLGLPAGAVEHQTLYRTLEAVSDALAKQGWVSREYLPSGELIPGMAYLVRRILENTSQAGFLTKHRMREDAGELLQPPVPGVADPAYARTRHHNGFTNTPAAALFDRRERDQFERTLAETRARWGARVPLRIGTQELAPAAVVPSVSPNSPDPSRPVAWISQAGPEQTQSAIKVANIGAKSWGSIASDERAAIGLRAAELLQVRKHEAAAWIVHEGGRTWREALADAEEAIDHLRWSAHELRRLAPLLSEHYRPRGVVACIPPWNFPLAIPAGMTAAALMAGNAVILKSAEQTPYIGQYLIDLYRAAGVPKEAANHVPGKGEVVGAMLAESPDVDMVAFTGSVPVGASIYETASRVRLTKGGVKKVVAEMGGKNAIVVFPDADMDEAVLGVLHSAFSHGGQKCSACSRVYVHRDIYERFSARLVEAARSLDLGPGSDPSVHVNPLISLEAYERVQKYGKVARAEGRVLLDRLDTQEGLPWLTGPLIIELSPAEAGTTRTMREEIFGPVLPLVPFSNEEEVVTQVNGTMYALTLGIFSRSPGTIARMVRAGLAGSVYVNRGITGARVGIEPFGGFKLSGTGPKAGGEEYLLAFVTRQQKPDGRRGPPLGASEAPPAAASDTARGLAGSLQPWNTPIHERLERLREASRELGAEAVRLAVESVLGHAKEMAEPQPTVAVPGQRNHVTWDTPRGVGLAAVDMGASPATLACLIFGALLAGNAVVVCPPPGMRAWAQGMVEALWHRGVPRQAVALLPERLALLDAARGDIHFAAADLDEEPARALYAVLGVTRREEGQDWLKAFISLSDGPRPGEAGFLRLFALPKTVAIQTLRHGADLEII